jgi:hypothetical protein
MPPTIASIIAVAGKKGNPVMHLGSVRSLPSSFLASTPRISLSQTFRIIASPAKAFEPWNTTRPFAAITA